MRCFTFNVIAHLSFYRCCKLTRDAQKKCIFSYVSPNFERDEYISIISLAQEIAKKNKSIQEVPFLSTDPPWPLPGGKSDAHFALYHCNIHRICVYSSEKNTM